MRAMNAEPNKPMVPTAATSPDANLRRPLRRHIGQPLGSREKRRICRIVKPTVDTRDVRT